MSQGFLLVQLGRVEGQPEDEETGFCLISTSVPAEKGIDLFEDAKMAVASLPDGARLLTEDEIDEDMWINLR